MQKYTTPSKLTKHQQSRSCSNGNSKSLTHGNINSAKKISSIGASKTNLNNYKTNKYIHEKLSSLSPINRTHKQENMSSRNNSNSNMAKDNKYQQEINKLKEEIKLLKQ